MSTVPQQWNQFYLKDVSFVNLMTRRIFNVLIVANPYDAFMLEDDGRVDEKLFDEYMELGMRYPPSFSQVSTTEEAEQVLKTTDVDLVICMPGNADNDAFAVARDVKRMAPQIPCVVLTPFSHGITKRIENEDMSIFDYVFCWLGNTNLILSIIKLIEDRMNIEHDINEAGVQMILLVEDNIRFYSSVLPNLYNYILAQSKRFSTEALNPHAAAQRKRGRPKVVLATNYEDAMRIYEKYHENTLGVISDTRFPMHTPHGQLAQVQDGDAEAGLKLLREIRKRDEYVPLILQSSESENRAKAEAEGFDFIDKNSKKMNVDLRQVIEEHMGFGDFIFRDPQTHEEVCRVRSLKELQDNIFKIPNDSMLYHISRNHMSRWLCARAIFPVSAFLKHVTWHKLQDVDAHRQIIFDAIVQYRHMKNIGVVAVFDRLKFDTYSHFARIGEGSLGGKGRGLAFLDNIIKRHPELNQYPNARVMIPKTVVLCTDYFDQFMDKNNLWGIALSDASDDEILHHFLKAQLPDALIADFFTFFDAVKSPIAVRSSSLLEDSHYQPFAGIYSTYMIPYLDDKYEMLRMLACAIKGVYASVYYKDSKAYMTATSNVIDQEKMAVILQEVVGKTYGDKYYPTFSGVLRSLNYYPIGDETAEEGIASLALGLGKYIVDGGQTLRVSPYHPNQVLQTSEMETALRETQTRFYALDMSRVGDDFQVDDGFNIKNLRVKEADKDGALTGIASTFDPYDQVIRDGIYEGGRKIISFCGVLQHGVFPLPEILQMSERFGADEMRRPVEIEFACNLENGEQGKMNGNFYLLQIRPIVDSKQVLDADLDVISDEKCLLRSANSLGHGISEDVTDVVYVKTNDDFTASENPYIADEIEQINRRFLNEGRNYVLVGPGRWGSSDYWLGIPVKWPHISAARVIVEEGLKNYHVDPSQGTHFFQNLTSFGVGYFTINTYTGDGLFQKEVLDSMPAVEETPHVRHVRFDKPLKIMMDGKKQKGVVLLPDAEQ
ncbi:phosphoenolpyruvate synthase [Prevotella sp. P3-120]|uniref:PEP/pyruvate-binding domain-containing protein n=1 Tax=unclassified Prevotella TaxID=2638335 RepID=UPI000B9796E0|nr:MULTISPECIES: PEP/pyruvate-binding domain-containing protein [unclassified Prevotella]MBS7319391.1 phosphoenolpyruvate synthase [Prevotella sp.]MDD7172632.1 PEP/pyruvate-binding domain-containing protein [Prevotella sp.]MEE1139769.1 PEP/pyruvate-binding domain-containing protein [Prevotella sp.]OYP37158.1 phosphoenolpyruvate synthase [Prevotella sp. P5-126]OYP43215.1 phosphoenolpyruvate synthase [Prevotella sp. P4-119]